MASEKVVTLTAENFDAEVIQSPTPVLVDFWAEWCGPCKMIGPVIDQLADENDGKAKIGKVNIDEHQQLAVQYNVQSIPTMLVFKGGQVAEQKVGVASKGDLQAITRCVLADQRPQTTPGTDSRRLFDSCDRNYDTAPRCVHVPGRPKVKSG